MYIEPSGHWNLYRVLGMIVKVLKLGSFSLGACGKLRYVDVDYGTAKFYFYGL